MESMFSISGSGGWLRDSVTPGGSERLFRLAGYWGCSGVLVSCGGGEGAYHGSSLGGVLRVGECIGGGGREEGVSSVIGQ